MSNFKNKRLAQEVSIIMQHLHWHYEPQLLIKDDWVCVFHNPDGSPKRYDTKEEAENSLRQCTFDDYRKYRIRPIFA
jgi:hypothetical protein